MLGLQDGVSVRKRRPVPCNAGGAGGVRENGMQDDHGVPRKVAHALLRGYGKRRQLASVKAQDAVQGLEGGRSRQLLEEGDPRSRDH